MPLVVTADQLLAKTALKVVNRSPRGWTLNPKGNGRIFDEHWRQTVAAIRVRRYSELYRSRQYGLPGQVRINRPNGPSRHQRSDRRTARTLLSHVCSREPIVQRRRKGLRRLRLRGRYMENDRPNRPDHGRWRSFGQPPPRVRDVRREGRPPPRPLNLGDQRATSLNRRGWLILAVRCPLRSSRHPRARGPRGDLSLQVALR